MTDPTPIAAAPNPPPAGHCPHCGYLINPGRCPECGNESDISQLVTDLDSRIRRRRIRRYVSVVTMLAAAWLGWRYYKSNHWIPYAPIGILIYMQSDSWDRVAAELDARFAAGRMNDEQLHNYFESKVRIPTDLGLPAQYPASLEIPIDIPFKTRQLMGIATLRIMVPSGKAYVTEVRVDEHVIQPLRHGSGFQAEFEMAKIFLPALPSGRHTIKTSGTIDLRATPQRPENQGLRVRRLHTFRFAISQTITIEDAAPWTFVTPIWDADEARRISSALKPAIFNGGGPGTLMMTFDTMLPLTTICFDVWIRNSGDARYSRVTTDMDWIRSPMDRGMRYLYYVHNAPVRDDKPIDVLLTPSIQGAIHAQMQSVFAVSLEWKGLVVLKNGIPDTSASNSPTSTTRFDIGAGVASTQPESSSVRAPD